MLKACRNVLLVEDDDDIRASLHDVLSDEGLTVQAVRNGAEAWQVLSTKKPCVVLVDLMMPVMSGWELVARMRATPELADVPVVVASAAAYRSPPGVDHVLAKPIKLDELLGAIRSYCNMRADETVQVTREQFRDLVRRNIELAELRRFRDEMAALLVHDLKNPLSVVVANLAYAKDGGVPEKERDAAVADAEIAARRMARMITNLLDLAKLETGDFLPRRGVVSISEVVRSVVTRRFQRTPIELTADLGALTVSVDVDLIERVIENIVDNAFRYTAGKVLVRTERRGERVFVTIANDGPAIGAPDELFEKYARAADAGRSQFGLGLYFCRLAVEAHGGSIRVGAEPGFPTAFVIDLPIA